jgi:hypothetical protein
VSNKRNQVKDYRLIDELKELLGRGGKHRVDMTALMERIGDKRRPFYDRVHLLVDINAIDWFTKPVSRGRRIALMEARPWFLQRPAPRIAKMMLSAANAAYIWRFRSKDPGPPTLTPDVKREIEIFLAGD